LLKSDHQTVEEGQKWQENKPTELLRPSLDVLPLPMQFAFSPNTLSNGQLNAID